MPICISVFLVVIRTLIVSCYLSNDRGKVGKYLYCNHIKYWLVCDLSLASELWFLITETRPCNALRYFDSLSGMGGHGDTSQSYDALSNLYRATTFYATHAEKGCFGSEAPIYPFSPIRLSIAFPAVLPSSGIVPLLWQQILLTTPKITLG